MTTVEEMFLGVFVNIILQEMYALIKSKITAADQLGTDLDRLKRSFENVRDILGGVEKSHTRRDELQHCLRDLRDVAYDANDLLDEIGTEGLRRDSLHLREVRDALSEVNPKRLNFQMRVAARIRLINEKIQATSLNNALRPAPEAAGRASGCDHHDRYHNRPTTGILSSEIPVFGRQSEAEQIVKTVLTNDDYSSDNHVISVIPILGIGGIGKTTLAQVVFNHDDMTQHFDMKLWVHVPHGSHITSLTKLILESVDGPTSLSDLNNLQLNLKNCLTCKRYLLVLDNLWNERSEDCNGVSEDWSELQKPLLVGERGSIILITTRNPTTAKITRTIKHPFVLHGLSYKDCWSVFAHHSFGSSSGYEGHGDLANLGKQIAERCCGSPLAARALGSHLRGADRNKWERVWENVSKGKILHLKESNDGILLSLESTYHQLPPHLKQCLRFCGIFPKDFKFERDVLVKLWMAHGFLGPAVERVEDVGAEYFNSLVDRLFFKPAPDDPSKYVMCDLISELARYVSHDECCVLEHNIDPSSNNILQTIRHSTLVCDYPCQEMTSNTSLPNLQASTMSIESFYQTKGLYTLLLVGNYIKYCSILKQNPADKMAARLTRLRVLDLGNVDIKSLHDSIKDLIHLRYLSLSSTKIKSLPESVCNLYNLQTLGLRNCTRLQKLPKNIKNMSKLRHLDLNNDDDFQMETVGALGSMPKDMGKLTGLQTLSRFVVSKQCHRSGIKELGDLNNIHGDLRLLKLHNVHHEEEAEEANLSSKKYLTRVELQWGDSHSSKQDNSLQEMVLKKLEVHTNLRELWIVGYKGASFPQWIGRVSYSRLVKVRLSNCRGCEQLPPLGQLPLLEYLCIKGMDEVKYVDCGFCGSKVGTGFQSLKILRFESMRNWKGWFGEKTCKLPALRELIIMDCPVLHSLCHCFPPEASFINVFPRS